MSVFVSAPVLVLTPLGLAWIVTRMHRTLPTEEEILCKLHDGELKNIGDFMPRNTTVSVLESDAQFWNYMGRWKGLLRKRRNAVNFVHLGQWYVLDSNMDKQDVEYFSKRALLIGFLILSSIPEQAVRLVWRGMPHFCARYIACLYFEAATQMQMLNLEYGTGSLTL
jgi:hypothetical protein